MDIDSTLIGRDRELGDLTELLAGRTRTGALAIVRGGAGIGRTALLDAFARSWRRRGADVMRVRFGGAPARWDRFGAGAVLAAARGLAGEAGDPGLATAVAGLRRVCEPSANATADGRSRVLVALATLFGALRRGRPVVVLADDLHTVAEPVAALAAFCRPGVVVVATCLEDGGVDGLALQLAMLADVGLRLGPLSDDDARSLFERCLPGPVDPSVYEAVRAALGPQFGVPGTLKATVDQLRRTGGTVDVDGALRLRDDDLPIVLPGTHPWLAESREHELEVLALVASLPSFTTADLATLARATGTRLSRYERAVEAMVANGQLVVDRDGALRCPCQALADSAMAIVDAAELHGRIGRLPTVHLGLAG